VKKKAEYHKKGKDSIIVRTLNGSYTFDNQRYKCKDTDESVSFLGLHSPELGQERGFQSKGLMEFLAYYVNLMSYNEVEKLCVRMVQQPVYTAKQIRNKMISLAPIAKKHLAKQYDGLQLCFNFIDTEIDLYDAKQDEIHYFDDGVGVKRQKAVRKDPNYKKESKTVQTDILVIEKPDKSYAYIAKQTSTPQAAADLDVQINCHLSLHYPQQILPFVGVTDGAKCIRERIHGSVSANACIILDWYHLRKKIKEQMSRLGLRKEEKEAYITRILKELWHGLVSDCLIYMEQAIFPTLKADKQAIFNDLLAYLDKHKAEIVDYDTRYFRFKTIGSGRGEKANDQIIAIRQKNNGAAWGDEGSAALATLKCLDLNQQWNDFWAAA